MPSASALDSLIALWREVGAFPAGASHEALHHLLDWIVRTIDADNIQWIGSVRALSVAGG